MDTGVNELLVEISRQTALPEYSLHFWHGPKYSSKLNPAEYPIHKVRRNSLYHVPCTISLNKKAERIRIQLQRDHQ